uniref:Uncharacterized protein n=1 Tax=viral metagenome TaxID=1070528 RepID=A0A6M3JU90_9ZZZZ
MKDIYFVTELTGAGGEIRYIPVPSRGNVLSVRVASDLQMDAAGTLTFSRGATTVNLVTVPAGNIAAGTILDGVPDTTSKGLIFDPSDTTAANKVIKMTDDATFLGGAATITVLIKYDDSAYVVQPASEA